MSETNCVKVAVVQSFFLLQKYQPTAVYMRCDGPNNKRRVKFSRSKRLCVGLFVAHERVLTPLVVSNCLRFKIWFDLRFFSIGESKIKLIKTLINVYTCSTENVI